jgi:hypothetical protein
MSRYGAGYSGISRVVLAVVQTRRVDAVLLVGNEMRSQLHDTCTANVQCTSTIERRQSPTHPYR